MARTDAKANSLLRGLAIRFDANADVQQDLIDHPEKFDPKVINALATITRDRSHQIIAAQSNPCRHVHKPTRYITGMGTFFCTPC